MNNFIKEMKRRKVFRVAGIYAVVAWLLTQITVAVSDPLGLPEWMDTAIIFMLAIGFPIAIVLAYAFDVEPDKGPQVDQVVSADGEKLSTKNYGIFAGLGGVAIALLYVWGFVGISNVDKPKANDAYASISVDAPVPGFSGRSAIAVLPFVNLSNDPEQEYLADGLTEDIITGLQAYQSFPVIARTSTFTYKGKPQDVRQIAKELGAGYLMEGSIRRIGEKVRITGQLLSAQGNHLWAEQFDVPWKDLVLLQDEIATKIIYAIEPEIVVSEADQGRYVQTNDMDAFDYYLRARSHAVIDLGFTDLNGSPVTKERLEVARGLVEKALEKDSSFAAAYTLLSHIDGAYVFQLRAITSDEEVEKARERAIVNSQKAREISPFEPTACSCQALLYLSNGEVERALRLQKEAIKVNPSSAIVRAAYALILHVKGDDAQALQEVNTALRLSPKDMSRSTYLSFKAAIEQSMGSFDAAADTAAMSILESRANPYGHMIRVTSLYAAGDHKEAQTAAKELYTNIPDFSPVNIWNEAFPESVTDAMDASLQQKLNSSSYTEGVALILKEAQKPPQK